jgi:hypothetical protein
VKACHRKPVPVGKVVGPLYSQIVRRKLREVEAEAAVDLEDDLTGSWASVRSAADLCEVAEGTALAAVLDGRVRAERRNSTLYVRLDDVAKLPAGKGAST